MTRLFTAGMLMTPTLNARSLGLPRNGSVSDGLLELTWSAFRAAPIQNGLMRQLPISLLTELPANQQQLIAHLAHLELQFLHAQLGFREL